MGKVRVATFGDEEAEKKQEELREQRRAEKKAAAMKKSEAAEGNGESKQEPNTQSDNAVKEVEAKTDGKKTSKYKKKIRSNKPTHSKNYTTVLELVDRNKVYTVTEALAVLPKLQRAKFDETVELHLNTTEKGVSGSMVLPHGTGKQMRVAIATDDLIATIEKGQIDFDILVADPSMMPKLAKVAKILGPRGLMPNPKNGTVSPKPEEVAKKYEGGQMNFKTEAKAPILHVTIGKVSFGDKKLSENIKTFFDAVEKNKIKNVTLKSTMSPGMKLDIASL